MSSTISITQKAFDAFMDICVSNGTDASDAEQQLHAAFRITKRGRKPGTGSKSAKEPKQYFGQCCARTWDQTQKIDGVEHTIKGIGGRCSRKATMETSHNGQDFYFCKSHGRKFEAHPELASNPRFERRQEHEFTKARAEKMGIEGHQETLWLGCFCNANGDEIDRPLPSDCVGEFNKNPLRWKDMKHARKQRAKKVQPPPTPKVDQCEESDSGSDSDSDDEDEKVELNLDGPFSFSGRDNLYADFKSGNVFHLPDPDNIPDNAADAIVGKIQSTRKSKGPRYSESRKELQYAKVIFNDDGNSSGSDSDEY